jgi:hypothetical protein
MALLATPGESEERRIQAATGRLFFGYFLFDCMDRFLLHAKSAFPTSLWVMQEVEHQQ